MQSRRRFVKSLVGSGVSLLGIRGMNLRGIGAPAIQVGNRPILTDGIMSGEVTRNSAVVWARCDREARMVVEWDTSERFQNRHRIDGPVATSENDFVSKVALEGLPAGQKIAYRVRFEDRAGDRSASDPQIGILTTASRDEGEVSFAWSGDTCGQGFGIDESRGGMKTYASIAEKEPQFLVHSGDTIYADNPIKAELALSDGTVWRNRISPEKSKVAETLADFRGNFRYNLMDEHVRRLLASTPIFPQWDDHEVLNNWYPTQRLLNRTDYGDPSVDRLAKNAKQAFFDYHPLIQGKESLIYRRLSRGPLCELFFLDMRSYRGPNSTNRQTVRSSETDYLGDAQLQWLKKSLVESRAVWKVVCSDMPLGLMVRDVGLTFENSSNGDGPPLGRELEIADLLSHLKRNRVRNVIWLTADVHYAASHYYNPARAQFADFDGFWEFVSGPLHAGTFGPVAFDNTFGPEVRWTSRSPGEAASGPWTWRQFFGIVRIDPKTRVLTVTHFDRDGRKLASTELAVES